MTLELVGKREESALHDSTAGRLSRVAEPGLALFAYGTLQFPEVLMRLIGRCPDLAPARVPDWRVAALPGRVYPGLVPAPGARAVGKLVTGLSEREWAVLDAFEDDEYELLPVEPEGVSGIVLTYVWTAEVDEHDWRAEEFDAELLADFLARYTHGQLAPP